jgi:hypothetical protein
MGKLKAQRLINMTEKGFRRSGCICITVIFQEEIESG